MKRKISIVMLLVAMLGAFSAQAQFKIGPRVGLNIDKVSISGGNFDESNRCGVTAGLQAEFMIPVVNFGFDASLMYTHMKTEVEGENISRNFLEIPVNLKYKFGIPVVSSFLKPYVFTGPTVAFRLGDKNLLGGSIKEKATQWGWNLGAGVELINHLQVGFNYTFGLNKVAETALDMSTTHDIKAKNNYWTVSAAWLF